MKETNVILLAQMTARPGMEERAKFELQKLVAPTLNEDGCIKYDLHVAQENAGEFMFYEIWRDRESLQRHSESAHISAFRKLRDELLIGPSRLTFFTAL